MVLMADDDQVNELKQQLADLTTQVALLEKSIGDISESLKSFLKDIKTDLSELRLQDRLNESQINELKTRVATLEAINATKKEVSNTGTSKGGLVVSIISASLVILFFILNMIKG